MERVYEKYAWVVYLALGLLWVVVGFNQTFLPDGLLEGDVKLIMGLLKMSWSFLVLAITLTGYRRGEKWAWYTLWLAPILLVSSALFNSSFVGDFSLMLEWIPITTISVLGLLLPYRKFFSK